MSYYAPFYRGNYYNAPPMPPQAIESQNMYMQNYQQAVPTNAQPMTQQTVPPTTNDMIWVQGLSGAKAYLVAPNTTVTLWDSERKTIYLKSSDNAGMPSMKILDYTESSENLPTENSKINSNAQITVESINALNGKFDDILNKLNVVKTKITELSEKPSVKNSKKSEE